MSLLGEPEPPPAAEDADELSDDQLDPVAGGARVIKPFPPSPAPSPAPSPSAPVPIPYPNVVTTE